MTGLRGGGSSPITSGASADAGRVAAGPTDDDQELSVSQSATGHLIGLLLGAEEDWPRAFEELLGRVGPIRTADGATHEISVQRLTIEPFDGGGWRCVSRVRDRDELHRAYDDSGEMLMHLQESIEGYDAFARSLTVGAETMVMNFRPELPMHDRYAVDHDFLDADTGAEVLAISRLINAFFRWEFNSCEVLVRDKEVHPIDYANACPDIAITSLHYYFPWAISALLKWSLFCTVTGRRPRLDLETAKYFEIADSDRTYSEKLTGYSALSESYFQTDRYQEFCATALPHLADIVREWVASPAFDAILVDTVRATYPQAEHERFLAHFRGLVGLWKSDNG